MIVYQVVESGGEYEDSWESCLGIFSTLEKAEAVRNKVLQKINHGNLCVACENLSINECRGMRCFKQTTDKQKLEDFKESDDILDLCQNCYDNYYGPDNCKILEYEVDKEI